MIAFTHRHICRWVFIFIKKASHRCGIFLIHDWFSFYSYCSVFGSVVSVPASPPVLSWSGGSVAAGSGSAVTGASVIVGASVTAPVLRRLTVTWICIYIIVVIRIRIYGRLVLIRTG